MIKNLVSRTLLISTLMLNFISSENLHAQSWHCDLISVEELIQQDKCVKHINCHQEIPFLFEKLPVTQNHYLHPYQGVFHKTFILNIPKGQVFGLDGWVVVNDKLINELVWQNCFLSKDLSKDIQEDKPCIKKTGRVAVIAQTGYTYYYHWLVEILGRLALLEIHNIDYDWLYVPVTRPFMKESLVLWGVNPAKIIDASDSAVIQADELIVPSLVAKTSTNGCARLSHYIPEYIVRYIKEKLLRAESLQNNDFQFSKKVFISRKDATARKIENEDEVFALFQAQGFERYALSSLSVVQQIALFKNAEIVVGTLGSGLANVVFCNPKAQIIDIFQTRRDATICYLCQTLGLNYKCVKTMEFIDQNDGQYDSAIPLDIIKELIQSLKLGAHPTSQVTES